MHPGNRGTVLGTEKLNPERVEDVENIQYCGHPGRRDRA
jgi:hypothetical protein